MEFKEDMFPVAYVFLHCNGRVLDSEKEGFHRFVKAYNKTADEYSKIKEKEVIEAAENLLKEAQEAQEAQEGEDEGEDSFDGETSFMGFLGKSIKKSFKGLKGALKEKYYAQKVIEEFVSDSCYDTEEKLSFIWLLVNMAYANGECDSKEKELLEYVFEKLVTEDLSDDEADEVANKALLAEFMDTAVALLAIEKKREYVHGTSYEESVEAQCKAESKALKKSVDALTMVIE